MWFCSVLSCSALDIVGGLLLIDGTALGSTCRGTHHASTLLCFCASAAEVMTVVCGCALACAWLWRMSGFERAAFGMLYLTPISCMWDTVVSPQHLLISVIF